MTLDVSHSKENDSFYKSLSLKSLLYQIPEMEITRELGLQVDGVMAEFDYLCDKTANSKRLIMSDHRGSVRFLWPFPRTYDKCNQGLFPLRRIKEYKYYPPKSSKSVLIRPRQPELLYKLSKK